MTCLLILAVLSVINGKAMSFISEEDDRSYAVEGAESSFGVCASYGREFWRRVIFQRPGAEGSDYVTYFQAASQSLYERKDAPPRFTTRMNRNYWESWYLYVENASLADAGRYGCTYLTYGVEKPYYGSNLTVVGGKTRCSQDVLKVDVGEKMAVSCSLPISGSNGDNKKLQWRLNNKGGSLRSAQTSVDWDKGAMRRVVVATLDEVATEEHDRATLVCSFDLLGVQPCSVKIAINGEEEMRKDMNQRLDRALEDARQCNLMYSIDPIQLPNEDFRFSINGVKGVTVEGEAGVYNGFIAGLSTIHRIGEGTVKKNGDNLTFTTNLEINNLEGQYHMYADWMAVHSKVVTQLGVKSVSVRLGLRMSMLSDSPPDLFDFAVEEVSGFSFNPSNIESMNSRVMGTYDEREQRGYPGVLFLMVKALKIAIKKAIEGPFKSDIIKCGLGNFTIPL